MQTKPLLSALSHFLPVPPVKMVPYLARSRIIWQRSMPESQRTRSGRRTTGREVAGDSFRTFAGVSGRAANGSTISPSRRERDLCVCLAHTADGFWWNGE